MLRKSVEWSEKAVRINSVSAPPSRLNPHQRNAPPRAEDYVDESLFNIGFNTTSTPVRSKKTNVIQFEFRAFLPPSSTE